MVDENITALHAAAMSAEHDWEKALIQTYGERAYPASRYDLRSRGTPELARLGALKTETYETFAAAAFPHRRIGTDA